MLAMYLVHFHSDPGSPREMVVVGQMEGGVCLQESAGWFDEARSGSRSVAQRSSSASFWVST